MAPLACAQQATSRTEQMEQIRTDKQARLWPEHTPGLVKTTKQLRRAWSFGGSSLR